MRGLFTPIAGLVVAFAAVLAQPVLATVVAGLDLAQLVARADRVVVGRIVDVTPARAAGRFTDSVVTMAASAVLKGPADAEVVFRVAGGESGRFRTVVVGAPTLRVNDEAVVFLAGDPPYLPHLVGFSQGVLPLLRDDRGRAVLLVPPSAPADGERAVSARGAARVMTVSDFADEIRAIAGGTPHARGGQAPPRRTGAAGPGHP